MNSFKRRRRGMCAIHEGWAGEVSSLVYLNMATARDSPIKEEKANVEIFCRFLVSEN